MKTIQISDEDYNLLMEFSKELQTQPNIGQAFPYFWEPASEKLKINVNNEGEVSEIYDYDQSETYTPEDYADQNTTLFGEFLVDQELIKFPGEKYIKYEDIDEQDWIEYVDTYASTITNVFSSDWEQKTEHNPSLFMSDVKTFIESNKHHLGRNPHTYARSVWRMPKMEKLIEIIYRINPQKKEDINEEARRFVVKHE